MLHKRPEKVKHRVIIEVCFDIEDDMLEDADARIAKIEREWMPMVLQRLGPWLASEHKSVKVVSRTPLDNSDLLRPAEHEPDAEAGT